MQLLKSINDSTSKLMQDPGLEGKELSLPRGKKTPQSNPNTHTHPSCPSIHLLHRHQLYCHRKREPISKHRCHSVSLGIGKVDMPLEITTRTPNHSCIACTTANAFNVIAAEVWNKIHSPTHCVQCQTVVLHLASLCDIIIRDGA